MNEKQQYEDLVLRALWDWAEQHCTGMLDGGGKERRPPVLQRVFAHRNVLFPPHADPILAVIEAIAPKQRHPWFHSLRSSQALAQSVFGAASAFGRLDVLEKIPAECGRPAFFTDSGGWSLGMERVVDDNNTLKEKRRTSIDVLLDGPGRRVAVECKFTEAKFTRCSCLDLKPDKPNYCDGSYRVQAGRRERCALTEIEILYWRYLPRIFDWAPDRDHDSCPFGACYQLARNALAACFAPDGSFDPNRGHVLLVYDKRNPAFAADGEAEKQWRDALVACRVPGLLRRVSWQRLSAALAAAPDLAWLAEGLRAKYGIEPAPR